MKVEKSDSNFKLFNSKTKNKSFLKLIWGSCPSVQYYHFKAFILNESFSILS